MQPKDRESILWQASSLPQTPSSSDEPEVDDQLLEAYRRGELSDQRAREVERLLVADPEGWQRLEAAVASAPDSELRERLLDRFGRPRPAIERGSGASRHWAVGLAATVVLALGIGWWTMVRVTVPTVSNPAYEVEISALARDRGPAAEVRVPEAYPETTVVITAAATGTARSGFEIALYGAAEGGLRRLDLDPRVERVARQGAQRFRAPASSLVGDRPGEHRLFLVIARADDLPQLLDLPPGGDPAAALEAAGRRTVHRLTLRLLSSDRNDEEEDHEVRLPLCHDPCDLDRLRRLDDPQRPRLRGLLVALPEARV